VNVMWLGRVSDHLVPTDDDSMRVCSALLTKEKSYPCAPSGFGMSKSIADIGSSARCAQSTASASRLDDGAVMHVKSKKRRAYSAQLCTRSLRHSI